MFDESLQAHGRADLSIDVLRIKLKSCEEKDYLLISKLIAIRFIKYIWVFLSFQRYLRFKNSNIHTKFINNAITCIYKRSSTMGLFSCNDQQLFAYYEQEYWCLMLLSIICFSVMLVLLAGFSQLSRIRVDIKIDTSIHNLKLNIIICTCRNHSLSNYEVIILVNVLVYLVIFI